jgi:cobalt-zinc-cadmium efflux system protein
MTVLENINRDVHDNHNINYAFKTGIIINLVFVVTEVIYGLLSNSMALVSDAGHNLSDVLALALSWIAIILSQRRPTHRFTYGLRRSTILVALLNSVLLLVAVGFIIYETIIRIGRPLVINSGNVIVIAAVGIVVNGFTAWLFIKGRDDLNIRSAFFHFIADTLVSLGVVIAGIIMLLTGIQWIDAVVSLLIILVIFYSSYHLLIDSLNLALDAVPDNIDIEEVRTFFQHLPEVSGVHDLHVWAMSTSETALTVHLATNRLTDMSFMTTIQKELLERFGLKHTTIQVEYGSGEEECKTNCC